VPIGSLAGPPDVSSAALGPETRAPPANALARGGPVSTFAPPPPTSPLGSDSDMRTLSLALVLCGFWYASSGRSEPLMLALLAASCVIVVAIARRLRVLDLEGHPTHLILRALGYWAWLIGQVVRSNLRVLRLLVAPKPAVSPRVVRIRFSQRDDLGRTIHANSITLTPGTITLEVGEDSALVHCLTEEGAAALARGELDARVSRVSGRARSGSPA
jgi:multicomponent Na+:H+ antiporter subunit E